MNIFDQKRKNQIFNSFIKKGCGGNTDLSQEEEKSLAEQEKEKELNKKD